MGDVITIAANLSTRGFERGSHALRQAINSLSRSVTQFGRNSARAATSVIGNFKRMLPMILGVGSAFGVISKAVSSFMAQNEELSSKMNSIWTALGNLIAPIMEQIINWITTAVSYFLEFLRLLGVTGKTASQLSQKANKSTQELKKTLAGFDELNILQDNNTNDKNKDAHLDDIKPSDWMKKLADLLKNKMWDEAADMIIEKMNKLIQTFKEKAYELGDKIGEYLGAALHIIGRVIDEVDWRGLGEGLANLINGIFNNPNMKGEDLGKILAGKFTIAFKILTAFLENFDSATIGKYFSDVITGAFDSMDRAIQQANPAKMGQNIANFFNNIDWDGIAVSVSTFLNDAWDWAVTALHNFLTNIKAKDIGASIRKFFENLDWDGAKEDLKQLLKDAWDVAIDFLWGIIAGDSEEEPPIIKSLEKLRESVEKVFEKVEPLAQAVWDKLKPILEYAVEEGLPKFFEDLADTLQDLTDLLTGEMSFKEFISDLNGLEKVIGVLIGLKVASFFGDMATHISKFINVISGAGGAGAAGGGLSGAITSLLNGFKDIGAAAGLGAEALGEMTVSASGTTLAAGTLTAAGAGLLAALGLIPAIMLDSKMSSDYFKEALEETGGSAEGMAQKMNELAETASHYDECLYDTTGATQELGYSAQESQYAMEAFQQFLPLLAEQLGLTTDQLNAQIAAAGGDVTQIEALKNSTSGLASSNNETANSQQNLNAALDETSAHIGGAATAANEAADGFVVANDKMQQAVNDTDTQADVSYSNIETNVSEKSGGAADSVTEDSNTMSSETQQAFNSMETTVTQSMSNIENSVTQGFASISQTVVQKTAEMNSAVSHGFQMMATQVQQSAYTMASQVTSSWQAMSSSVIGTSSAMSSSVQSVFSGMMSSLVSTVNSMASAVESRMAQMAQTVANYSSAMNSSFSSNVGQMPGSATTSMGGVSGAVQNALGPLGNSAGGWGRDMMMAFRGAIDAAIPDLIRAMQAVSNTVSSYLHFSEPDVGPLKNFHTFAPDMMRMYKEGILGGQKDVMKAAASIAEGVSAEFGSAEDDMQKLGNNMAMLSDIKKNVEFRTPGVVGGGVVPYSVSDTSANAESVNSSYEAVMNQNDRIMDILDRILDAIMEGKVIAVDKYKFGELLVKTLSNEARARGQSLL